MITIEQARAARAQYFAGYGREPSPDELVAFIAIKEAEDAQRFVRVHFPGNTRAYCYEILLGTPVKVGDYLQVWSPHTERKELVRVAYLGRGPWTGRTKLAHRVQWQELD